MIIYLVGATCVGKTTIGKMLAEKIAFSFVDLDDEIENYFEKSTERIRNEFITLCSCTEKTSIVLDKLFSEKEYTVISGTPSGLMFSYLRVYKKHKSKKLISICLNDSPENILNRLTFYDIDSKLIPKKLDEEEKKFYLREVKADYNYFKKSHARADFQIDINNVKLENIPEMIVQKIGLHLH